MDQTIRFTQSKDGTTIAFAHSGSGPPLVKAANWLTHLEFDWESPVWRHWLRELSRRREEALIQLISDGWRRGNPA